MSKTIFSIVFITLMLIPAIIAVQITFADIETKRIEAEGQREIDHAQAESIMASVEAQRQDTKQVNRWPYIAIGCAILFSLITICSVLWSQHTQQRLIYTMLMQFGASTSLPSIILEKAPWLTENTLPANDMYVISQNSRPEDTYMIVSQAGK